MKDSLRLQALSIPQAVLVPIIQIMPVRSLTILKQQVVVVFSYCLVPTRP
jgi:hypothetical protein